MVVESLHDPTRRILYNALIIHPLAPRLARNQKSIHEDKDDGSFTINANGAAADGDGIVAAVLLLFAVVVPVWIERSH